MKSWDTLLGLPYPCACGGTHMCGIERVVLGRGALAAVGELTAPYKTNSAGGRTPTPTGYAANRFKSS